ncbi:MAG: DUF166 domain-containing protein [Candidatus Methanofastidiosia archaeon]
MIDIHLYIFYSGEFGEIFVGHLINARNFCISCGERCTYCRDGRGIEFGENILGVTYIPAELPPFIKNPKIYLPKSLPRVDIMVAINLHPDILMEIPVLSKKSSSTGIIFPIESPSWIPPGLERQLQELCEELSLEYAFPKPFCSLSEDVNHPKINDFIEYFKSGRPKIEVDLEEGMIKNVRCLTSAPCGNTYYVCEMLRNVALDEKLPEKISEAHHAYPCTASMEIDPILKDSIMHKSGYIIREEVLKAIEKVKPLKVKK